MTLLPAENRDVKGVEGPEYPRFKVGPLCAAPQCSRTADHAHHIWRRSFLCGDYAWVKLWDGHVLGNLCGLCYKCHSLVTENKAQISWSGHAFIWLEQTSNRHGYYLEPQPPVRGGVPSPKAPEWYENGALQHVGGGRGPVGPAASERCPTCKRTVPNKVEHKHEGKRPRRAWSITVPVDERENGADVLDTLLNECAKLFGHDETRQLRYFTVVQALALVVQHGERMVGDE